MYMYIIIMTLTMHQASIQMESGDSKAQQESKKPASHCDKPSGYLPAIEQLLASQNRKLIRGDGNCVFQALSLLLYGSEIYHLKIRELLVNFVRSNADKFRVYVTKGTTLEDHLLHMQYMCGPRGERGPPRWSYMLQHLSLEENSMFTHPLSGRTNSTFGLKFHHFHPM